MIENTAFMNLRNRCNLRFRRLLPTRQPSGCLFLAPFRQEKHMIRPTLADARATALPDIKSGRIERDPRQTGTPGISGDASVRPCAIPVKSLDIAPSNPRNRNFVFFNEMRGHETYFSTFVAQTEKQARVSPEDEDQGGQGDPVSSSGEGPYAPCGVITAGQRHVRDLWD